MTDVPAPPAPPAPPGDDDGWQRLDIRKLLLDPVKALGQFLVPVVIAILGISRSGSGAPIWVAPLLILGPILFGTLPWLTTRYRITATQFQQRSGLLNKKQVTAPLDRIRSVDLEATLLHRILGLSKVQIGTGVDDTRITLDALTVPLAEELRRYLLARTAGVVAEERGLDKLDHRGEALDHRGEAHDHRGEAHDHRGEAHDHRGEALDHRVGAHNEHEDTRQGFREGPDGPPRPAGHPPRPAEEVLARIDWSWLRFAPFRLSRLAVVAGAIGVLSQFGDELPIFDEDSLGSAWRWVSAFALPLVIVAGVVAGLALWVAISVAGYVLQWWGLLLVRERGLVRLTAGLFTTRSTSVEEARIRGVALSEPVLLRLVGGGELATLATGVGAGGVTKVLPPCPVGVATEIGHTLLEEDGTLTAPLVSHGPLARRRCHVGAQWPTWLLTLAAVVAVVLLDVGWWLPVLVLVVLGALGVLAAEMEWRHLGHTLTDQHLVSGSGALVRSRTALERDGVIGWVVSQSYFQRRLGLATLTATTAAGAERVTIRDLALGRAVALADAATPGLLGGFLAGVAPPTAERPPAGG